MLVVWTGFKTPVGTYAITGIFVLPLWLYGMFNDFLTSTIGLPTTLQVVLLLFLVIGRALAMCAEVRIVKPQYHGLIISCSKESSSNSSKERPVWKPAV